MPERDRSVTRRWKYIQGVGDSITEGHNASDDDLGYRRTLFEKIGPMGYYSCGTKFYGGLAVAGPYTQHNGYSGICAMSFDGNTGLDSKIAEMYPACRPDLILLMVGVNSIYAGRTPEQLIVDLRNLRALIRTQNPGVPLVNLTTTPTRWMDSLQEKVQATADALPGSLAGEPNTYCLNVHDPMLPSRDTLISVDGVHPNQSGYTVLGNLIADGLMTLPLFP